MSNLLVETNAQPLPVPPEVFKGMRIYFPPMKNPDYPVAKGVLKKYIDELTTYMKDGKLTNSLAVAHTFVFLAELHD